MTKVYYAGSYSNALLIRSLSESVQAQWNRILGLPKLEDVSKVGHSAESPEPSSAKRGLEDIQAVMDCDVLVAVHPLKYNSVLELGVALGAGKQVILYAPSYLLDPEGDPTDEVPDYLVAMIHRLLGLTSGRMPTLLVNFSVACNIQELIKKLELTTERL